ncbi:MAG: glutamine-hydrolyzing carbamoyl-phosphate synthase small subunit [Bacteroidetes bacterium]|nr:glutamine-hydrolyzing carbamoyl-phosphate synthase small subunit [Fibrella sp.]
MKRPQQPEALLVLQDGTVFKGFALGKRGKAAGEICFNTGMTGYQEIYTDPSYYGQVIINTTSHIGNYGVQLLSEEESSGVKIRGMVCNFFSQIHSRNTADESLQTYFEQANIVGIHGVDTRQLVRYIRDKGVMNCIISSEILDPVLLMAELQQVPDMAGLELSSEVCTQQTYEIGAETGEFKIAVLDLGVKKSILKNLTDRGAYCKVFPAKAPFAEIAEFDPDGYFIANGPGDPAAMPYAVDTVKQALETEKPLFGICLGHQILSLASGIATYKMHNGHRGLNHPVKNLITGRCEVTSQNHGFAVKADEVQDHANVDITHLNLNDKTIEGIRRKDKPAFSVQYHPEASPGPHDSRYLFDQFVQMIK